MKVSQFEHVVRAAADVLGARDVICVGSQAILGQLPDRMYRAAMMLSRELDIIAIDEPEGADMVSGALGLGSPFDEEFGVYADGVAFETVTAPSGWRDRLVPYQSPNTNGVTAHCIEMHDLVLAKYVAGREKDHAFIRAMAETGWLDVGTLTERAATLPIGEDHRAIIRQKIQRDFGR